MTIDFSKIFLRAGSERPLLDFAFGPNLKPFAGVKTRSARGGQKLRIDFRQDKPAGSLCVECSLGVVFMPSYYPTAVTELGGRRGRRARGRNF